MELGGSDAYLVLEDADIGQAAKVCAAALAYVDDQGDTSRMVPVAGPTKEAYPLYSINVPALNLGSPDEPLSIDRFVDVAPEPSESRDPREEDPHEAKASIEVRGPDRKAEASIER